MCTSGTRTGLGSAAAGVADPGDDKEIARATRARTTAWLRDVMRHFAGANETALWAGVVAANGALTETSIAVRGAPALLAMVQTYYGGSTHARGALLLIEGADACAMFRDAWDAAGGLFPAVPEDRAKVTATHRLWAYGALLGRRWRPSSPSGPSGSSPSPSSPSGGSSDDDDVMEEDDDGSLGGSGVEATASASARVDARLEQLAAAIPRLMAALEQEAADAGALPAGLQPVPSIDVAWELVPAWKAAREERSSERARQEAEAKAATLRRLATPGPLALNALAQRRLQRAREQRRAKTR